MADKLAELRVEIKAETDRLKKDLDELKSKTEKVGNSAKKSESSYSSFFKQIKGGYLAALGAVTAFVAGINKAIDSAKAQITAEFQVANAVKKTGAEAGFTSRQLTKMADGLEAMSGTDSADVLKKVTLQLLTFGNIAGDTFVRAQKAALDLSAVIGTDLTSQTIQLGKALDKPTEGISALSRAGVKFSDVQEENIKNLVKQGDLLGAQNIILTEIESKYGGQAEAIRKANAGINDFDIAMGNLGKTIGKILLPIINSFAGAIAPIASALESLITPSQKVSVELSDAQKTAASLSSQYNILTGRILELKSKTKLNSTEQDILKQAIDDLVKIIPNYVDKNTLVKGSLEKVTTALTDAKTKLDEYTDSIVRAAVIGDLKEDIANTTAELVKSKIALLDNAAARKQFAKDSIIPGTKVKADTPNLIAGIKEQFDATDIIIKGALKLGESKLESLNKLLKEKTEQLKSILAPTTTTKTGGGGNTPIVTSPVITPVIPPGYTAQQVAVYEKLKFAAKGYLEFAKQQLELKANADIDAVNKSKDAEDVKAQKIKNINQQLSVDLQKLQLDQVDFNKSAQDKKLSVIKTESERELAIRKQVLDRIKNYFNEYFDAETNYNEEVLKHQNPLEYVKKKKVDIESTINSKVDKGLLTKEQGEAQKGVEFAKLYKSAVSDVASGLSSAVSSAQNIGNVLGLGADTFVSKLLSGLSDAVSIASSIINIIAAFSSGGALGFLFGHTGGTFQDGKKVASFAKGGSFVVPSGFPNDSFPLLVESGERVSVTPKSNVGNQEALLQEVVIATNRLADVQAASTATFMKYAVSGKSADIYIDSEKITKAINKKQNKLANNGVNFNAI